MRRFTGLMFVVCFVCVAIGVQAQGINCSAPSQFQEPPECRDGGPSLPIVFDGKARFPGDTAYAHDIGFVSDNFVSFPLADMTSLMVIATNAADSPFSMDYDASATTLWAIEFNTNSLGHWNTGAGTYTQVVPLTGVSASETIEGLAIDPTTGLFYLGTTDGVGSWLYSINEATGACTLIGQIPGASLLFDIKIDNNGIMYGHDGGSDVMMTIDKATAASTVLGPTGYNANFAQGMDFDPSENILYAWIYTGGGTGAFCSINLTTGAATNLSWVDGEWVGAIDVAAGPPVIAYVSHDGVDSCASNPANTNGVWEPGEMIDLDVQVVGGGDFTGVTGTLSSSTAGVTILGNASTWPDLTAGAPAWSNTPFEVYLEPTIDCMSRVLFEVTLNSNQGGPWVYSFTHNIGQALQPVVPVAIPDDGGPGNPGISTLDVGDDVTMTDLNVWVNISHTWVGDLIISLRSPAGTEIVLLDRPGVPATGTVGCSDNNMIVTFDDASVFDPESHCAGTDPWYTGDAMPVQPLAAFNGESTMGTWQLIVSDNAGGDTGNIEDWGLISDPAVSGTCEICEGTVQQEAIPTLNTLGILVLIGILVGVALVMMRRM